MRRGTKLYPSNLAYWERAGIGARLNVVCRLPTGHEDASDSLPHAETWARQAVRPRDTEPGPMARSAPVRPPDQIRVTNLIP